MRPPRRSARRACANLARPSSPSLPAETVPRYPGLLRVDRLGILSDFFVIVGSFCDQGCRCVDTFRGSHCAHLWSDYLLRQDEGGAEACCRPQSESLVSCLSSLQLVEAAIVKRFSLAFSTQASCQYSTFISPLSLCSLNSQSL